MIENIEYSNNTLLNMDKIIINNNNNNNNNITCKYINKVNKSILSKMNLLLFIILVITFSVPTYAYRLLEAGELFPNATYFLPYDRGFVGSYGEPTNLQRERINEGAFETGTQELLYEDSSPRQACPNMVGPFSDGNFFCTAKEFGYCDRRSGTCFCNVGYQGIDCSECHASHFLVGTLCFPKKLCQDDCNNAGKCNFFTGTCDCYEHRVGDFCQTKLCSRFSPLCERCTEDICLRCLPGYYLTGTDSVCGSCYDYDPRCSGCTKELGCTSCADPILLSIRRSGYRLQDPKVPVEEDTREFGITLPFGTKSSESFADAEHFLALPDESRILKDYSVGCDQGNMNDDSWECSRFEATHRVCGHFGVFVFQYPNYEIREDFGFIRMSVRRSGGGMGNVVINYYVRHFTTNDSDVTGTAPYTTSQQLLFNEGVVERTFLINILDDNVVEENEVLQVVLETPEGGGSVGAQFRTNITIVDDDLHQLSPKMTRSRETTTSARAGDTFKITVQAQTANGDNMTMGGERFFSVIENDMDKWAQDTQRHALRKVGDIVDVGDGTYDISSSLKEQGNYQMRTWHAFPGGLKGQYYSDGFFENLALERIDKHVNFTWGNGRLIPRGSDYITIKWSGVILTRNETEMYYFKVEADDHSRLWIDGQLLLDHWQEQDVWMEPSRPILLEGNTLYEVILEYREVQGDAHARLLWGTATRELRVIPMEYLFSLYEIDRSPVSVVVISAVSAAKTTECTGTGLFLSTSVTKSEFTIYPRDIYRNFRDDDGDVFSSTEYFTSNLALVDDAGHNGVGSEKLMTIREYNLDNRAFDVSYIAERAGFYKLNVLYRANPDDIDEHVAGSPFDIYIKPGITYGPFSDVNDLQQPLLAEAGQCYYFNIIARDASKNLRLVGGDDFSVYTQRVDYSFVYEGTPRLQSEGTPTFNPTQMPTLPPTAYNDSSFERASPPIETAQEVIRYGVVKDLNNGTYSVTICPVIAGLYEVHVLLNSKGISNQPFRILDRAASWLDPMGKGSYTGQYVADSPYTLSVSHSTASAYTSTAVGVGLKGATVGIPVSFMVTVRDSWDNVLISQGLNVPLSVSLDRTPNATVSIWNYNNGSYNVEYIAIASGDNLVSIKISNAHIRNSPFTVPFLDGKSSEIYSYAIGKGLHVGTAGIPSYFEVYAYDIDNNRKTNPFDQYSYIVNGNNNITGILTPCPKPPISNHEVCDSIDTAEGHYFGAFTALNTGFSVVSVFLDDLELGTSSELNNSPFSVRTFPNSPHAEGTDIRGIIYDNIAGVDAFVTLQLRDSYGVLSEKHGGNKLESGGHYNEMALLGVGVEWGTIRPWGTTPGLQDSYHYRGFYSGFPDYYGQWIDNQDGSYLVKYNAKKSGQYVMRFSIAEPGLNATFFNTTDFGSLNSGSPNKKEFIDKALGEPLNLGSSISWTGDIGRRPDPEGAIGEGTYIGRFKTRFESTINFNLSESVASKEFGYKEETYTTFPAGQLEKYRQEFWSVRYFGLITPKFAEEYIFSYDMDDSSTLRVYVGGVGNMMNDTNSAKLILDSSSTKTKKGAYNFTDNKYREFIVEYSHNDGVSFLQLLWESPSTHRSLIPASSFTHWRNMSHFNTTIHPAPLCSRCSTAWGDALNNAIVDVKKSFLIYSRDSFDNLLQKGGDVPTVVAVGRDGVSFRGEVTDYGNSTYLVEYYANIAGEYRLYVTMGCCAPHPNVGLPAEIELFDHLLIKGSPFILNIAPAPMDSTRSTAIGKGLLGGISGQNHSFTVLYRDIHNNPTSVGTPDSIRLKVVFIDRSTNNVVEPLTMTFHPTNNNITVQYNHIRADKYDMHVSLLSHVPSVGSYNQTFQNDYIHILGSPFYVITAPNKAFNNNTVCRGIGLKHATVGRKYSFEIQLYDIFNNPLISGGSKLFVRLVGDSSFNKLETVTPICIDDQNGKYQCSYNAIYSGQHHLVIRLLNNSIVQAGGLGLTGRYYSSIGIMSPLVDGSNEFAPPLVTRIDPKVHFSWPTGLILPIVLTTGSSPANFEPTGITPTAAIPVESIAKISDNLVKAVGQTVRWDGYVIAPRTDTFSFATWLVHMNSTIYIDSVIVYDSLSMISQPFDFAVDSAYEIVVEAIVSPEGHNAPVSIQLMWSTPTIKWTSVPSFFLFDAASDIVLSPFPVTVT
jgi:hypothetical protein